MSAISLYFLKMLEDAGMSVLSITQIMRANGRVCWDADDERQAMSSKTPCTKMCLVGGAYNIGGTSYFISCKTPKHGHALMFQCDYGPCGSTKLPISAIKQSHDTAFSQILESVFLQALSTSDRKSLFLNGQLFIKKGTAYMHLVDAEVSA